MNKRWLTRILLIAALVLSMAFSLAAQDDPDDTEGNEVDVPLGSVIEGEITNANTRAVYQFDGKRGERMVIRVRAVSGTLDPVITIFDNTGHIIVRRDDDDGEKNIVHTFTIDHTDRYFVAISRFAYALGTTTGRFELEIERSGVLSTPGSTLSYGDAVINTITSTQPEMYYTFEARRGDIVNIRMLRNSGNLDPYLQVVNSQYFVIADNDDVIGSDFNDAMIQNLLIEDDGLYVIVATRYGQAAGDTVGSFVLMIDEAQNSGLGNSRLAPFPLLMNQFIEGQISADQYERYYTFEANQDDIITIRMDWTAGQLDSYLILTNASFQPLIEDDDGGNNKNALIRNYRIPGTGTYYIIASRFERENGTTAGGYRLQLEFNGNAFDGVPPDIVRLRYGTTITGRVDDTTPDTLYAFYGAAGDTITVSMNRQDGNLDPVLELLDAEQVRILRDDDGGDSKNARIERYTLKYNSVYYIRATRYDGSSGDTNTSGSFIVVLAQRFD